MFPIIPYNFNTRLAIPQTNITANSSIRFNRVVAGCDLPKDVISGIIKCENLCEKLDDCVFNELQIELSAKNDLVLKSKRYSNNCHWIRYIRLADDCHSYNAKLCLQTSNETTTDINFVIQITKFVKRGQELLLWFSEDVLAHLQMAFLTPINIQGQKKYVCHNCCTSFEYPNPLKLHLTLDCDKQPVSSLWNRLSKITIISNNESTKSSFGFQLKAQKSVEYVKKCPITSSNSISELPRPVSEPSTIHSSAFKPYLSKKPIQNNNSIRLTQSVSNFTTLSSNYPLNYQDNIHAAQMETIVSNLGRSKQGHLCIYCGKCYSRKYGLKIHIRTHTGYKPLKCKYCLRPFGDPSNLNKHVRLHAEGDTPYKCELCGKILVRRRDLERHLRSRHIGEIHLGEKVEELNHSSSEHSDN